MPSGSEQAAAAARAAKHAQTGQPGFSKPPSKLGALFAFMRFLKAFQAAKGSTTMGTIKAKSALFSKINWTQAVAMLAMLLSMFGMDLDAKTQADILAGVIGAQAFITWILRTFFNNSVSPELAGKTVTVVKA